MPENKFRARGEAAYRYADASLGLPPPKPSAGWRGWPIVRWVLNGQSPSLWVYSRLCLLLAVVSLLAGFTVGVVGGFIILGNFGEGGAGFAVNSITASFTLSTPGALLLVGSGILAYLAARNDRESAVSTGDFDAPSVPQPEAPPFAPGNVPSAEADGYEARKSGD
jgi:hypothetical protein